MIISLTLFAVLPTLILCAGEGNIRLLEDEIATAIKSCLTTKNAGSGDRHKRSTNDYNARIDDNLRQATNKYNHGRRNSYGTPDEGFVVSTNDYDNQRHNVEDEGHIDSTASHSRDYPGNLYRQKRNEPFFNKSDTDQCLSQCVFANLQVVDPRGIPREAELWNLVQSSVTSQQSRAALRDQLRACFQELQTEAEDNGCSYSNKLERCLMLRFADRKQKNQSHKR